MLKIFAGEERIHFLAKPTTRYGWCLVDGETEVTCYKFGSVDDRRLFVEAVRDIISAICPAVLPDINIYAVAALLTISVNKSEPAFKQTFATEYLEALLYKHEEIDSNQIIEIHDQVGALFDEVTI